MCVEIIPMVIADYEEVVQLWRSVEGVGLHDYEDSREGSHSNLNAIQQVELISV
jgi:hypothetical protein